MTLVPGARLGPYEILAAIGAGGMGEVYLARDPRLGREVAIKVLLGGAVDSAERRARFEREAKAIAALNHPNIVTIFAVEEAEGVPFFTMEHVDGRTLAQMIPAGGLPLGELLRIAIPLTDAVGAAHQRGILHRDLKPANVMVTTNGRIKVLDFGLAKLREVVEQADGTTLPTAQVTGEGRILGTVAYMSPEQAEGKALDQRSDVFSLGVMLYEMATGQRPFKGDTSVSVISAILKDTPGSITELRPELPRDLGRIVKHALSKDPEHRYQTAKDLRNDLETLKEDLDSGEVKPVAAMMAPAARGGGRWWVWPAAIVVAAAVIAGGMFMLRPAKAPDAPSPSRPFDEITIRGLTSDGNAAQAVAVSPDGRYVAHAFVEAGRQGLRVRQAETSATVQVVAPADVQIAGVTFTPDGNRLSYLVLSAWERDRETVRGSCPRRHFPQAARGHRLRGVLFPRPDAIRVHQGIPEQVQRGHDRQRRWRGRAQARGAPEPLAVPPRERGLVARWADHRRRCVRREHHEGGSPRGGRRHGKRPANRAPTVERRVGDQLAARRRRVACRRTWTAPLATAANYGSYSTRPARLTESPTTWRGIPALP